MLGRLVNGVMVWWAIPMGRDVESEILDLRSWIRQDRDSSLGFRNSRVGFLRFRIRHPILSPDPGVRVVALIASAFARSL
jgi:hypothetical protein